MGRAGAVQVLGSGAFIAEYAAGLLDPTLANGVALTATAAIAPLALCATVLRTRLDRVAALVVVLLDASSGAQVRDAVAAALPAACTPRC